ncbi:MAG: hypothetical protein HC857_04455 [Synechococcales cyanobacterium RU_4_20]|nr:hypothetical protein [Synechococcales cyanobacterium RU_4_20]
MTQPSNVPAAAVASRMPSMFGLSGPWGLWLRYRGREPSDRTKKGPDKARDPAMALAIRIAFWLLACLLLACLLLACLRLAWGTVARTVA